jgi:hypothetical protein
MGNPNSKEFRLSLSPVTEATSVLLFFSVNQYVDCLLPPGFRPAEACFAVRLYY